MDFEMTVVMSCYNQAKYLRQAVDSVLSQKTDFGVRLIITDDHSTVDESREIIRVYAARYPDRIVALLNDENGRYLKNVFRAMALVKTPYFTLLDADDYWTDPDYLQKARDFLAANPDYTIYCQNVVCLVEDGMSHPYVPREFPDRDFVMADYYANQYVMSQTAGEVFRNVVYGAGVPEILSKAIGTPAERPYEGDVARFLMHLAKGKARFVNVEAGVYRLLSSGIWCRLSEFERHLLQARGPMDFYAYFKENKPFFVSNAYRELTAASAALPNYLKTGGRLSPQYLELLASVSSWCAENCHLIDSTPGPSRADWVREVCGLSSGTGAGSEKAEKDRDRIRWYRPFRALRLIARGQKDLLAEQKAIRERLDRAERMALFERTIRRLRIHGVELPPDVAPHFDGRFEVCERRLGDLRCKSPTLGIVPYSESYLYRYLKTRDPAIFEAYRRDICIQSGTELEFTTDREEFEIFARRLETEPYDIAKCAIVILNGSNVVIDGNHRVAALLAACGADCKVKVVKLFG